MTTNKNGLTFGQWVRAANLARKVPIRMDLARQAWLNGEDPTDYAVD